MKALKNGIAEAILDETGIRLSPNDITINNQGEALEIKFWDSEVLILEIEDGTDIEDDDFIENTVGDLFDEYYDLREKLIELKIDGLNNSYLPTISQNLTKALEDKKVERKILKAIDFEFIESPLSKPGEEWDFPALALRVTDFEGLEYYHPVNVYQNPFVVDCESVAEGVVKKIRGKI